MPFVNVLDCFPVGIGNDSVVMVKLERLGCHEVVAYEVEVQLETLSSRPTVQRSAEKVDNHLEDVMKDVDVGHEAEADTEFDIPSFGIAITSKLMPCRGEKLVIALTPLRQRDNHK